MPPRADDLTLHYDFTTSNTTGSYTTLDGNWRTEPITTTPNTWTTGNITIDPNTWISDRITIEPETFQRAWTFNMPDGFYLTEIDSEQEVREKKEEIKEKSNVKIKGSVLYDLISRIEELEDLNMKLEKYANAELAEEWDRIMKG